MIPLWLKLAYTLMVAGIVPVYWARYGPSNFLWFSDVALLLLVPALWLENGFIASTMAVGVLLPELYWNASFFLRLLTGLRLSSISDYMFEPERPRYLRALSLFHVVLPPLLLWLPTRLGYSAGAFAAQTVLAWIVLPLSYFLSDPGQNVNWVHGWGSSAHPRTSGPRHLALLMVLFPLVIFLPTHLLLMLVFG